MNMKNIRLCISSSSLLNMIIGMAHELVANNTNDYFNIASRLAKDREYSYHIRVKILESIDGKAGMLAIRVYFYRS